jgi:hypothetical protein
MTLVPPPPYDHWPSVPVIEHVFTSERVNKECSVFHNYTVKVDGCTIVNKIDGKCYIVRINSDIVRRHELAHCNGWHHE